MKQRILFLIVSIILMQTAAVSAGPAGGFLLDGPVAGGAPAKPFRFTTEVTPETIGPGGEGVVSVHVGIAPGHKLYASRMTILPQDAPGLAYGRLTLPDSVEKKEPDGGSARFYVGDVTFQLAFSTSPSASAGPVNVPLTIQYQGCSDSRCFFPQETQLTAAVHIDPAAVAGKAPQQASVRGDGRLAGNPYAQAAGRFGLLGVLAAAFVWGLLASLTPCVYPMIPITMSVIGSANSGGVARGFWLSAVYVLGMSLVYAAFGVAAAWSGGLFGALSDHPATRIFVAVIFVALALSLFDLFHIQMPSWVAGRLGGKFGGGALGVFLTGAASGAVVGPCVGPLMVALLVYIATLGDKLQGFLIMWSFALGMGTLFLVIGTFSGAAVLLPKSGPWMARLKQFFGVMLLGAALYYVAPMLPGNALMLCIGAYLIGIGTFIGGWDALPAASGGFERLRKTAGVLLLTLGIAYTARFALYGVFPPLAPPASERAAIQWMTDEAEALRVAEQAGKPVLIDFYADWCAACKELDETTFAHPKVAEAVRDFVPLRVDSSDPDAAGAEALRRKYGIVGLPTILFVDDGGRVVPGETITEFVPPGRLLEGMARVAGSAPSTALKRNDALNLN